MVLWNEIRKIFEFKMVLILLFISLLIYQLLISFDIKYFPNGRPALDEYNIHVHLLEKYGISLDEGEYKDFKKSLEEDISEVNHYLNTKKEFIEAGVTNFDEFEKLSPTEEDEGKLRNLPFFEDRIDAVWEIQVKRSMFENYENQGYLQNGTYQGVPITETQKNRIKEVVKSGNVFSYEVFSNYNNLILSVTTLNLICIMFMVSPIFLRDKNNKMVHLQYSSKKGRTLFKTKLYAALLSAFLIITIQLVVFFLLYSKNNTGMFLNSNVNSIFIFKVFWFDLTFLQYILLSISIIYILGFFSALITAILSSIVPNYLTVIGVQVPIIFIFAGFIIKYLIQTYTEISFPIYLTPMFYTGLILVTFIIALSRWKREKRIDILT